MKESSAHQAHGSDPFRTRRILELLLTVAGPIIIIGIWELLSRSERIDPRFWPAPSSLWNTAETMVREDDLLGDIRDRKSVV